MYLLGLTVASNYTICRSVYFYPPDECVDSWEEQRPSEFSASLVFRGFGLGSRKTKTDPAGEDCGRSRDIG